MTSIFLIFKIEKIRHDILQQLVQIMESQLELEGLGKEKRVNTYHHTELDKIKEYFQQYGYVVITDVITANDIENTISEICQNPALLGDFDLDINKPENWDKVYIGDRGFVDVADAKNHSEVELEWFWKNRQHPNIVKSFENIFGSKDILLNVDRASVIRPTKGPFGNPDWKTKESWLHWDKNPWKYPTFNKVQGLLTLSDHTEDSGGFCCVPGFHHELLEWGQKNLEYKKNNEYHPIVMVPKEDEMQQRIKKILAPAGSLIIWDSGLPHCNYPNTGYNFRIAQYITFEVRNDNSDRIYGNLKTNFFEAKVFKNQKFTQIITPLGRQITNFDEFEKLYNVTEKDVEAWKELCKATDCEKAGKHNESIVHYTKASKLSKLLNEIYL